jgi:hypothetical protein
VSGDTQIRHLDRLTRAFEKRGWRDREHAAVDIVRVMEASPLATARRLAKSADRVFLDNNGITRDDLADLIGETFPDTKA